MFWSECVDVECKNKIIDSGGVMGKVIVDGNSKFILNPTRIEMGRFLSDFETAAFWLTEDGDLALGGNMHCSIDHSTIANAFGLGDEISRGYLDLSGPENMIVSQRVV
jgi:hypothetical protein